MDSTTAPCSVLILDTLLRLLIVKNDGSYSPAYDDKRVSLLCNMTQRKRECARLENTRLLWSVNCCILEEHNWITQLYPLCIYCRIFCAETLIKLKHFSSAPIGITGHDSTRVNTLLEQYCNFPLTSIKFAALRIQFTVWVFANRPSYFCCLT